MDSYTAIVSRSNSLFYRKGFVGIAIESILEESGVSRGTFYKYFESKRDVVLAVLKFRAEIFENTILNALGGALDERGVSDALFDVLRDWHARYGARGCLFQTAASEYGRHHPEVFQLARDHKHRLQHVVESALSRVGSRSPRRTAEQLLLLLEGAVALGQFGDQQGRIDAARSLAATLFPTSAHETGDVPHEH